MKKQRATSEQWTTMLLLQINKNIHVI